jgi:pimeloyl-ACP methyl ester carboxylesterase
MKTKHPLVRVLLIATGSLVGLVVVFLFVVLPLATRPTRQLSQLAQEWQDRGSHIGWTSTLPENSEFGELDVFTIQSGDPANPAILMIHGYPTSSFDFHELVDLLDDDYYVVALDTPGYGLSDKPKNGFVYSLFDDALLVEHYVADVLGLDSFAMLTHDKGNSVGLAFLDLYQAQADYEITHHFITNGNIYLPLADLTRFQNGLLDERLGPFLTRHVSGHLVARGLADGYFSVPQPDAVIEGIATSIDYDDGGEVQHATIQYLAERAQFENGWLETLEASDIPTTLIWGLDDPVAPVRVADYVWEEYLFDREAPGWYWQLEDANHYLQNDQPETMSLIIRFALGEEVDVTNIPAPAMSRIAPGTGDDR